MDRTDTIVQIVIPLIGLVFTGIAAAENNKEKISNFILGFYLLSIIYFYLPKTGIEFYRNSNFYLKSLFLMHLSKSITMMLYSNNNMLNYLNPCQILTYYFLETMFVGRIYTTYILVIILCFIQEKFVFITLIFFLVFQILNQANNNFEVYSFQESYAKIFLKKYREINKQNSEYLQFLIFLEDKDYFTRKTFIFSPITVLKRKKFLSENKNLENVSYEKLKDDNNDISIYEILKYLVKTIWVRKKDIISNKKIK